MQATLYQMPTRPGANRAVMIIGEIQQLIERLNFIPVEEMEAARFGDIATKQRLCVCVAMMRLSRDLDRVCEDYEQRRYLAGVA